MVSRIAQSALLPQRTIVRLYLPVTRCFMGPHTSYGITTTLQRRSVIGVERRSTSWFDRMLGCSSSRTLFTRFGIVSPRREVRSVLCSQMNVRDTPKNDLYGQRT